MINFFDLLDVVCRSKTLFAKIKDKYPELKGYLVFSRFGTNSGQCNLTTDAVAILNQFPKRVVDDSVKAEDIEKLRKLRAVKDDPKGL